MAIDAYKRAFSNSFACAIVDFKPAVERGDKSAANIYYIYACGLISGATLSGGVSKKFGLSLMSKLEDSRSALMAAFGDMPPAL